MIMQSNRQRDRQIISYTVQKSPESEVGGGGSTIFAEVPLNMLIKQSDVGRGHFHIRR